MEDVLMLNRKHIDLYETPGEVTFTNDHEPDIFDIPLAQLHSEHGVPMIWGKPPREAMASGVRSAIIIHGNSAYKIKGCMPCLNNYSRFPGGQEPYGSQILASAERELHATDKLAKLLDAEGLPVPSRPIGYFKYATTFGNEPLAASIIQIEGDTRLSELMQRMKKVYFYSALGLVAEDIYHIEDTYRRLGEYAGSLKRFLSDNKIVWSESISDLGKMHNVHRGNYVVFTKDGNAHLGIVDLDDCTFIDGTLDMLFKRYHISLLENSALTSGLDQFDSFFAEGFSHGYSTGLIPTLTVGELESVIRLPSPDLFDDDYYY